MLNVNKQRKNSFSGAVGGETFQKQTLGYLFLQHFSVVITGELNHRRF